MWIAYFHGTCVIQYFGITRVFMYDKQVEVAIGKRTAIAQISQTRKFSHFYDCLVSLSSACSKYHEVVCPSNIYVS